MPKSLQNKYQNVLDLDRSSYYKRVMKPNLKKTRTGCLSCRKRKKKCDEQKPICKGCTRNKIECIWPENVIDTTDMNSGTIQNADALLQDSITSSLFSPISTTETPEIPLADEFDAIFNFNDDFLLDQFIDMKSVNIILSDKNTYLSPSETNIACIQSAPSISQLKLTISLNEHEQICYNAFLNFLTKSITLPHCHADLTPASIITPFVNSNETVKEVALACGASWLGYCDEISASEAIERYNHVLELIIKELKNPKANYTDYIFVCVQLLHGMCMRNKNIGFNITLCAAHFSSSYSIIKKRFLRNKLIKNTENLRQNFEVKPLDRLLMDHFVLFYSMDIMLCHSSKLKDSVPSPYLFFDQFFPVMNKSVKGYENQSVWIDHPILGITLKTHQIVTKCSWSCRFLKLPIPEDDMIIYYSLLIETTDELENLSNLLKSTQLEPSQIQNIHLGKSMLYACMIVLKKLCSYHKTTIESLQELVNLILEEDRLGRELDPEFVSNIWALFIGASCANTSNKKIQFSKLLKKMANQLHSSITLNILNFLNLVWDEQINDNTGFNGFEFLFDKTILDIISI